MMTRQASGQQLISFGKASNLLGVNQITLRSWADKGLVRVFRTAGGHRRFAKEDLVHLVREEVRPAQSGDLAERAVRGFRRHLKSRKAAGPGLNSMNSDSREHLRVLGRRLVEIAIRFHWEKHNRTALLEEARVIGRDYATENQKLGYTLTEAVEFFLSHRNRFVEIVLNLLRPDVSRDEILRLLRNMAVLSDAVMLALIAGYQKTGVVLSPHRNSSA